MPKKLPSGLSTFEPTDTVRRIAQNDNIEATDKLFRGGAGHGHTGKDGDGPKIGGDGIAFGALERRHLHNGRMSVNVAKFRPITITAGTLHGLPTNPYDRLSDDAWPAHRWVLSGQFHPAPQSLTVSLGKTYTEIHGISFDPTGEQYSPASFLILTSSDNQNWQTVYSYNQKPFVTHHWFDQPVSASYIRLTITGLSPDNDSTIVSCFSVYAYDKQDYDALEDLRPWGLTSRLQGLMIMPGGTVTDNRNGSLTFSEPLYVMNPAAGSYFTVKKGTYTLNDREYLYADIDPTTQEITPKIGGWTNSPRHYDAMNRIVLAQRLGNRIYLNSSLGANTASVDLQVKDGRLQFHNGTGWKGVGIKAVQRGVSTIRFPEGNTRVDNIVITPVDRTKTFVQIHACGWSFSSSDMNFNTYGGLTANLIEDNILSVGAVLGSFNAGYYHYIWEVIEFA